MIDTDLARDLSSLLPEHVVHQRWYGAKDRQGVDLRVLSIEELAPPWPGLVQVVIEPVLPGEAGGAERYQLLLGLRPPGEADSGTVGGTAAVGLVHTAAGPAFCFDALVDAELSLALLHHIAPGQEVTNVRPIGTEQSNSSLVYDERVILKVFRRLSGSNPEIEVTLALAQRGFAQIAEPLAVWRTNGDDLAILQRFLPGASDGWALALTSIRDLLDEKVAPGEAGGDFAPEVERLAMVTAEMHLALADAFGALPGDARTWADATAVRVASVNHDGLDRAAIAAALDRIRSLPDAGQAVRIHGDYHLGQVMRADEGWYVLDFEGEPARPVEERRQYSSPLRDVAGMLRSFAYAAAVGLREQGARAPESDQPGHTERTEVMTAEELAAAWEAHNRDAFLGAYLARLEGSPLLPGDPAAIRALLQVFELDKAVYEVAYEQAHRPTWVQIPLGAVRRLVDSRP